MVTTQCQRKILNTYFASKRYLSNQEAQILAARADLTVYQVCGWFSRQRKKEKSKLTPTSRSMCE